MGTNPSVLETEITAAPARTAAQSSAVVLILLSVGHLFIDLYSSGLGALQPLLVEKLGLTLTQAGILGGVLVFSSSVMQPVYGYLSDRMHTRMFVALSPAVAGLFISSLGLTSDFAWLLFMVFAGGAGIAAFHPQASATASLTLTGRRGRAMAIFISAGTLGLALGPSYFSAISTRWGLEQIHWAALPGVLVTLLLLGGMPATVRNKQAGARFDWASFLPVWKPLAILYALVFIRSTVQITFTQFLPLYLHLERGFGLAAASGALSLFLAAGALGGFIGGQLSDRFGGRRVIQISMIGSIPFLSLFFLADGWTALAGLLLGGLVLLFTIPVNVVMAQELLPSQASTVSALMMGFAWGMAGIVCIPLTGKIADLTSLHTALFLLVAFPLVGYVLTFRIPRT